MAVINARRADAPQLRVVAARIAPSRGLVSLRLRELWEYRELIYFLTWRDVKVRYKQAALGAAWAVIQPVLTMVVFTVFFGRLARVPSDGLPYPIFSFAALVPWTFFANGLLQSANSLVRSAELIKKVYFPRLVVPISAVASGILDFFLALLVLVGLMVYYKMALTVNILWLPLFTLLALVTSLGVGLWLSALNVQYRNRKFDEIVDFAEVAKFIDTPVKHYSTGMYLRLAFAVAAHLEPEILLVDEVLAVGDARFQKKCPAEDGRCGA
jgi:lipopolysaccharide transport system permease protein